MEILEENCFHVYRNAEEAFFSSHSRAASILHFLPASSSQIAFHYNFSIFSFAFFAKWVLISFSVRFWHEREGCLCAQPANESFSLIAESDFTEGEAQN